MSEVAALRQAVAALDGPVFAVLDGAQFADLPDGLLRSGLAHRPLYLDRGDNHPERLATAPRMAGPLGGGALDTALALLAEPGPAAAVFWHCPAGADRLYRHLRGLNMVRIPRQGADARAPASEDAQPGDDGPPGGADGGAPGDPYETLLFRHADANVMAQVAPALEAQQLARLLGPADALFFLPGPDWQDPAAKAPVRILRKQDDWPKAQGGMLTIDPNALAAMGSRRAAAMRIKRVRLLRRSSPSLFEGVPEYEVASWAEQHERSGRAIGLTTERGLLQWTYLMGGSKGRFADDPHIRAHLTSGPGRPDRRLDAVMGLMVRAGREDRE